MQFRRVEENLQRSGADAAARGPRAAPRASSPASTSSSRDPGEVVRLTDAWYQKTREQLVQRWEEAGFRAETRALLAELRLQHRRLKLLDAQLA